jgi:TonB-linked SusC/RagA family outer membrane protein
LANRGFYPDTQWQEELYKSSAPQYLHNLSVTGGSEKVGYLLNASALTQEGLVLGSDNFKRRNFRIKVDADLNDWLTVGTNTVITNRITTTTPAIGNSNLLGLPFFPVRRADGLWVDKGSPGTPNPIAQATSGSFTKTVRDAINMQLYAKVSPLKGLTIEERVSIVKNNTNVRDWNDVYDFITLDEPDPNTYTAAPNSGNFAAGSAEARSLRLSASSGWSLKTLTKLNYEHNFGDHAFDLLLGFQSEDGESENVSATRNNFPLGSRIIDLKRGLEIQGLGNSSSRVARPRYLSYFGRLNYDFKGGVYNLSFSFRYDGSSNFLDDRQFEFFPAIGGAWNIGDESFLDNVGFIDKLKLRASYGLSGDDRGVGPSVRQLVNFNVNGYPIGGVVAPSASLGQIASRDLQWETSEVFNVGLDFSLWQGLLEVKSDYFINNRKDILDLVLVPVEFGFGNVPANLYDVKSWGWELEATHNNKIGNVDYFISANITDYDNEITDLNGLEQPNFAVGQSINDRFGYVTDGFFDNQAEIDANVGSDGVTPIDQSNVTPGGAQIGRLKYVDQLTVDTDGDGIPDAGDGIINTDDRVILTRNSAANLNIGMSLGASYKGLSLSARLYGSLDRDQWWNNADAHEPFLNGTNAFAHQLNYWSPENPNAFFPKPEGVGIQQYDSAVSHFIRNNEFIKLQNVTLSYDLDKKTLDKLKFIRALRLTCSVENVGTLWTNSPVRKYGWDPELGVGTVRYPQPVITSLSDNVKF